MSIRERVSRWFRAPVQELRMWTGDALLDLRPQPVSNLTEGGNPYTNKSALVQALIRKYHGYDTLGNALVRRIVNTHAAFVWGRGLSLIKTEQAEREFEYLSAVMKFNDLAGHLGIQLGIEAGIEGQVLALLEWDRENGLPRIKFLSWLDTHYKPHYRDNDYTRFEGVTYQDADGISREIPAQNCVLLKFNCRLNDPEGNPLLAGLLPLCDDIEEALYQIRLHNRLFASITPHMKVKDMAEAKEVYQLMMNTYKWRHGKLLVSPSDYSLVGPQGTATIDCIRGEIETKIKILSGGTGIPVQFLGFPEFMSNRATAQNTMEPVSVVSRSEQNIWVQGLSELFNKALTMKNKYSPPGSIALKTGRVAPRFAWVTQGDLDNISNLYYPMVKDGMLSLRTLLGMLDQVVDVETELETLKINLHPTGGNDEDQRKTP